MPGVPQRESFFRPFLLPIPSFLAALASAALGQRIIGVTRGREREIERDANQVNVGGAAPKH